MKKRLYAAYGSNLNKQQMKHRCPTARLHGTGVIKDYELQFKGKADSAFATIVPKEGASVPVAIWELRPSDELALDRYEGYPSHYSKENIPVETAGKNIDAMVYIMNPRMQFGLPFPYYYRTVYEGYNDCGLDTEVLKSALRNSAEKYYDRTIDQTLFDITDEPENGESEDEEDFYDEPDEADPYYFFRMT